MNFSVPDKISKLFVLAGIVVIAYSTFKIEEAETTYFSRIDEFDVVQDSLQLMSFKLNQEWDVLKKRASDLALIYDVPNPITSDDSSAVFTQTFVGEQAKVLVSDSISKYWDAYRANERDYDLLQEKVKLLEANLQREESLKTSYLDVNNTYGILGSILLALGLLMWYSEETSASRSDNISANKSYPWCQSCGKRFSSIRVHGTDKNWKRNNAFCSECYTNGTYTGKYKSREQLLEEVEEETKDEGWLTKKIIKARIANLERWRKHEY